MKAWVLSTLRAISEPFKESKVLGFRLEITSRVDKAVCQAESHRMHMRSFLGG